MLKFQLAKLDLIPLLFLEDFVKIFIFSQQARKQGQHAIYLFFSHLSNGHIAPYSGYVELRF